MKHKTIIEPFRIKTVEPIKMLSEEERLRKLAAANYNPFKLRSEDVIIDLLTDSGTSAMSAEQWAGIAIGDESYAGSRSFYKMQDEIRDLTGFDHVLPTHQGRAAERIMYGLIGGAGKTFISNTHFDTTRANIEFSGSEAIDIPTPEALNPALEFPFKGNLDINRLQELILEKGPESIAAVIVTVTNNSGGGQPVSMENMKAVRDICKDTDILLLLDCCRIAENSYFVKHREPDQSHKSYRQIAQEMFRMADGALMSAKKDAMVNMGGFLALQDKELADKCQNLLIITEGFSTYGGLAGRDMEAIAIGLREVFEDDYLEYRIKSTSFLGNKLSDIGVPVMKPIGGHAIYIDAKALYPHIPAHQYPGQTLVSELYLLAGIRAVEIGSVMFGKYNDQGDLVPAPLELVRLAIPRRVYTQSHLEYVIETFNEILKRRNQVNGYKIVEETRFLRHFTASFSPL